MEINIRAVSRRQEKLIGKFRIAAGDVISIRDRYLVYSMFGFNPISL